MRIEPRPRRPRTSPRSTRCGRGSATSSATGGPGRWSRSIATFAVFGFSFMTMMPVFARDVLRLDAGGYGAMVSAIGVGAAAAAFFMAGLGGRTRRARLVLGSSMLFGLVLTGAALAPELLVGGRAVHRRRLPHGAQRHRRQHDAPAPGPRRLRGRVMGFYSFVVLGHGAVRLASGRLDRRALRGAHGDRQRRLVCLVVACVVAWRMWETVG